MGREALKVYDTFEWTTAVEADEANNVAAVPAEDRHDLVTVLAKFDRHFGVQKYRSLRRQEFLDIKRKSEDSIMDFIAELKQKAELCEYGERKESFICDKIINGINDSKVAERLLDIPDDSLTLERVITVCRQCELSRAHLQYFDKNEVQEVKQVNKQGRGRGRSRGRGFDGRGRGSDGRGRGNQYNRSYGNSANPRQNTPHNSDSIGYQGHLPYCKFCCKHHERRKCPAYNRNCDSCGQKGHFKNSSLCKNRTVRYAEEEVAEKEPERETFVFHCTKEDPVAYNDFDVCVLVNGKQLNLEIDTGAQCNIISRSTVEKLELAHEVKTSNMMISGIHNSPRKAFGSISLPCMYNHQKHWLTFQIIDSDRPTNLIGRHDATNLDLIARINTAQTGNCTELTDEYRDVLGTDIGCLPGEIDIKIDPTIIPVVHPPRQIPVAIRDQTQAELDRLEKNNIIAKVTEPSSWVNSMVTVRKKNGKVRICIDPSDLNKAIMREHFPMNTIEDIATRLTGAKIFSTLDANSGYFQVKLTDRSSRLTTFNTPFGRYRYLRMPMGAKCSAEIFQREMTKHFSDIDGVEIVVDDILVHGKTQAEHNSRLRQVLQRCREINLKLNKEKSHLHKSEVTYVGHKLTSEGLKPSDERIRSIVNMREPENFQELDTILGMVAYVAKFIPKLSELNSPLRELRKSKLWNWTETEKNSLKKIKETLTSKPVLKYFDVKKPVLVTVDASMKGLGAAIIQDNAVIAYASRSLTQAEERYAQIEKEALAVVFGCTKFHKLIYGMPDLTIESDHKPLETIMKKPIHRAPLRIQRMLLKLQPYSFKLIHTKGTAIGLADCLSRLPTDDSTDRNDYLDDDLMILKVDTLPAGKHETYAEATQQDDVCRQLVNIMRTGWPETRGQLPQAIRPYWEHRDEMSVYNKIIMRGERVLIPEKKRKDVLQNLHQHHLGITKTKQLARDTVYWPQMNAQIEDMVSRCEECLQLRNRQQKEPMIIHPIPDRPWSKVGSDLFELSNRHYIVAVDYYSNFIEVDELRNQSSKEIITKLKRMIARHGIMDTLISDNGPCYMSAEFTEFTRKYGIEHITSSPYRPQSNGLAEKSVQIMKRLLSKCEANNEDFHLALLQLRNTPRDDAGSPAQRLMGRRTQTLLPVSEELLKPKLIPPEHVTRSLMNMKETQKFYYDRTTKPLKPINDQQGTRLRTPAGWIPAEYISNHDLPNSHWIKGRTGNTYRRNRDMIMATRETPRRFNTHSNNDRLDYIPPQLTVTRQNPTTTDNEPEPTETENRHGLPMASDTDRPRRQRQQPTWMKDYVSH